MIQMKEQDFKSFQAIAANGSYEKVPFTKVTFLKYNQSESKCCGLKPTSYMTSNM